MADFGDEGGSRLFSSKDDTTRGRGLIQVQMRSGKIYGPYQRAEILRFIEQGKVNGEELMLVEGETQWRPLSSDTEFFDALHEAQLGVKSTKVGKKEKTRAQTQVSAMRNDDALPEARTRVSEGTRASSTRVSEPESPLPHVSAPSAVAAPQARVKDYAASGGSEAPKRRVGPLGSPLRVALLLAIAGGVGFVAISNKPASRHSAAGAYTFQSDFAYARPLLIELQKISLGSEALPTELKPSETWSLPAGLGAHAWIEDMRQLQEEARHDANAKTQAEWWGRWAWNALWIGHSLSLFDPKTAERLQEAAWSHYGALQKRGLVPDGVGALFAAAPALQKGDWVKASADLKASKNELAQALAEESEWWRFWAEGAQGDAARSLYVSGVELIHPRLASASAVRRFFVERDKTLIARLEDLAAGEPEATQLWFVSAQLHWRITGRVQAAYRFFLTGLPTLSLQPVAVQRVYWQQFAEFLNIFGRQATAKRASANAELVLGSTLQGPKQNSEWWDLGQEGFELEPIAQEIFERSTRSPLTSADLGILRVLSFVMPNGADYLSTAAYHEAFERNWGRAGSMFEQAVRMQPQHLPSLGGWLWASLQLFQFDKAFEIFAKIKAIPQKQPINIKYSALIHWLGREPETADNEFNEYLKRAPDDAWAHYFRARFKLDQENFSECSKSAGLARLNGKGELQLRARLLGYHCQFRSGRVGNKELLQELEDFALKESENIPVLVELIQARASLGLMESAIALGRESVGKFPGSFALRMKLAEVYEQAGEFDRAIAFYQRAAKEEKDSAEAWVRIGKIFEAQERFLDAAQNYETASRKQPDYPELWLFAARAYRQARKPDEAARMYIKEIEARPAVPATFIEAAEFLLEVGAPQEVPKLLQKFQAGFQDDPRVLTRLSQAYLAMGEVDKARTTAVTAIKADPALPEPQRMMGVISDKQGQHGMARQYFEKYLELFPEAPDASELRRKLDQYPYKQ